MPLFPNPLGGNRGTYSPGGTNAGLPTAAPVPGLPYNNAQRQGGGFGAGAGQVQVTRSASTAKPLQYWPLQMDFAKMYHMMNQQYGNQSGGGGLFGGFNPFGFNFGGSQMFGQQGGQQQQGFGGYGQGRPAFNPPGGSQQYNPYGMSY